MTLGEMCWMVAKTEPFRSKIGSNDEVVLQARQIKAGEQMVSHLRDSSGEVEVVDRGRASSGEAEAAAKIVRQR